MRSRYLRCVICGRDNGVVDVGSRWGEVSATIPQTSPEKSAFPDADDCNDLAAFPTYRVIASVPQSESQQGQISPRHPHESPLFILRPMTAPTIRDILRELALHPVAKPAFMARYTRSLDASIDPSLVAHALTAAEDATELAAPRVDRSRLRAIRHHFETLIK
jgi:hypothetical protein